MTEQDIETFIRYLDSHSRDMCVYPSKQTTTCCDCYLCRVDYFDQVRNDLRKEQNDKNRSNQ